MSQHSIYIRCEMRTVENDWQSWKQPLKWKLSSLQTISAKVTPSRHCKTTSKILQEEVKLRDYYHTGLTIIQFFGSQLRTHIKAFTRAGPWDVMQLSTFLSSPNNASEEDNRIDKTSRAILHRMGYFGLATFHQSSKFNSWPHGRTGSPRYRSRSDFGGRILDWTNCR